MDLYSLLILGHIIGTSLGLGGSVIAEAQIGRALKDKKVSEDERALMHANYFLIRVGLVFIVLSGIGLIFWHLTQGSGQELHIDKLFAKAVMISVILINAVLLIRHLVPLWLGASLSFTSWLGATVLGAWRGVPFSFLELMAGYAVAIFLFAYILNYLRTRA